MDGANTETEQQQTRYLAPPWRPGQSGNPSGRPKGLKAFRERLRDAFAEEPADGGESLLRIVLKIARDPEHEKRLEAIKFCAEYGFGKPPKKLDKASALRVAQGIVAQMLAEAEMRAQARADVPIEEAEPVEELPDAG